MKVYEYNAEIRESYGKKEVEVSLPFEYNGLNVMFLKVKKDKQGNEYFVVPDFESLAKDKPAMFEKRPADALDFVKKGYADALIPVSSAVFCKSLDMQPVKFLDENIGKEMQKKTLESWGKAKVKYVLFRSSLSLSAEMYLRADYRELAVNDTSMYFVNWHDVDLKGHIKALTYPEMNLPESDIVMADTQEEAEAALEEAKSFAARKGCNVSDYVWGWRQYFAF
jgi:hypothetical protein